MDTNILSVICTMSMPSPLLFNPCRISVQKKQKIVFLLLFFLLLFKSNLLILL